MIEGGLLSHRKLGFMQQPSEVSSSSAAPPTSDLPPETSSYGADSLKWDTYMPTGGGYVNYRCASRASCSSTDADEDADQTVVAAASKSKAGATPGGTWPEDMTDV